MIQNPLISIIIPVYNAENYLSRCIESIINQDFKNFELLLIDDGSTDNSQYICDEYARKDYRINVFHKPNGGVSSARNLGLKNAKGKWITFIDSDDYITSHFFEESPTFNTKFDLYIIGYQNHGDRSNYYILNNQEYLGKNQCLSFYNQHIHNDILRSPWCKFYKNSIIQKNHISFNKEMKYGEDLNFVLEYLQYIESIKSMSGIGYHYLFKKGKYMLPPIQSAKHLELIWNKYINLKIYNQQFEKSIFLCFYGVACTYARKNGLKELSSWYKSPKIEEIYKTLNLSIKQKIKYQIVDYKF